VALHREQLKDLAWQRFRDRFEILKRWALLTDRAEGNPRPAVQPAPGQGRNIPYRVRDWGLLMLSREFGVDADSDLSRWVRDRRGQPVGEAELRRRLQTSSAAARAEEVLRAFEDHWFQDIWTQQFEDFGLTPRVDPGRLLLALLDEILRLARQAGASLLLFSTHEQGQYEWDRYWFHVPARPELRERYLAMNEPLQAWAQSRGVDFLLPGRPITRARNDPHPNREGNVVMAQALADFLEARHAADLPRLDRSPTLAKRYDD
jgi:hypothetical protein